MGGISPARRRQHRLAGAGRAHHQQVVTARGGDLDGPFRGLLALDIAHVGVGLARCHHLGLRRRQHLGSLEVVDDGEKVGRGQDLDLAGPGGLGSLRRRADEAAPARARVHGRRQHPGHGRKRAVERELAQRRVFAQLVRRQDPHGGQQPEADGKVEVASLLEQIGGRQVDGDPFRRQSQRQRAKRRAHAFAAFGHRLVGKADDGERGQAVRHLDLNVHVEHVYSLKRHRVDARDHRRPACLQPRANLSARRGERHPRPSRPLGAPHAGVSGSERISG